jgi:uncharacterized caspase-like protein
MKQQSPAFICLTLLAGLAVLTSVASSVLAQEKCNYAADIVVQARELARPNAERSLIERHSRLLERATSQCQGDGDAWYYRYLYARQLGNSREAEFFHRRAEQFNSEALRRNEDPFAVSTTVSTSLSKAEPASSVNEARKTSTTISPYVREKWALVVGVSNFRDKNIPKLTYPAKDAKDFANLLQDPGYGRFKRENVALLTDEKATTVEIKRQIEELIRKAQPEDLVVFFLSSHGSPRQSSPTGVNYVVTHDTEVSSLYATSLSMVSIVDDLNKLIKAQRVVVFLDTCYSGAAGFAEGFSNQRVAANTTLSNNSSGSKSLVVEGLGISADILSRIEQSVGRVIITASQPNEVSWESEKLKNGIFTYYLIEALKQSNGLAPIKDMFSYLSGAVTKRALEEKQQSQHPTLRTSEQFNQADIRIGVAVQTR